MQKTKDNHYVPRFYLKNFLNKEEILYCFDTKNNSCFIINNLKEICKKTNLYTIKNKISPIEQIFYTKLLNTNFKIEDQHFCSELTNMLNNDLGKLFSVAVKNDKDMEAEINNLLKTIWNKENISRKQETLFTYIENDFQKLYNDIINTKNIPNNDIEKENVKLYLYSKILRYIHQELILDLKNSLNNDIDNNTKLNILNNTNTIPIIDIMHYMLCQYFRTFKVINSLKENISKIYDKLYCALKQTFTNGEDFEFNFDNVIFLFIHIQPILVLCNMLKDNYNLILLKNRTYTPFLISDNPCINTYGDKNKKNYNNNELEIYFPLTPFLSLLFTKQNNVQKDIDISEVVDNYNSKIIENSNRYIYANDKKILEKYLN